MKIALCAVVLGLALVVDSLRKVDPKKELQEALKDAESCDDL
jgi:hypothetical protein